MPNQIVAAVSVTSSNSNAVGTLGVSIVNNTPQPSNVQPIADKMDELIAVLRR